MLAGVGHVEAKRRPMYCTSTKRNRGTRAQKPAESPNGHPLRCERGGRAQADGGRNQERRGIVEEGDLFRHSRVVAPCAGCTFAPKVAQQKVVRSCCCASSYRHSLLGLSSLYFYLLDPVINCIPSPTSGRRKTPATRTLTAGRLWNLVRRPCSGNTRRQARV